MSEDPTVQPVQDEVPVSFSLEQVAPVVHVLINASPIALALAKTIHTDNKLVQRALDSLPLCVAFLEQLDIAIASVTPTTTP